MAKIQDREATIKTASVEIKALTVSGKQVTLALFRQIVEERLIDESTLQYRGMPWGTVNYHLEMCKDMRRDHIHVVWQKGEELRRSAIEQYRWVDLRDEARVVAGRHRQTALVRASQEQEPFVAAAKALYPISAAEYLWGRNQTLELELPGFPRATLSNPGLEKLRRYWRDRRGIESGAVQFEEVVRGNFAVYENCLDRSAAEWLDGAEERDEFADNVQAAWSVRYAELRQLDQLFIAV